MQDDTEVTLKRNPKTRVQLDAAQVIVHVD